MTKRNNKIGVDWKKKVEQIGFRPMAQNGGEKKSNRIMLDQWCKTKQKPNKLDEASGAKRDENKKAENQIRLGQWCNVRYRGGAEHKNEAAQPSHFATARKPPGNGVGYMDTRLGGISRS